MEASPKILIVEDDAVTARLYQRLLESHGYEIKVAPDGEFAQAALVFQPPDLVLLDLILPKASGVEVLKFLRSLEHGRKVPVIVFSNALRGNMLEAARSAGATHLLAKAECTPERLLETIANVLASRRASAPEAAAPAPPPEPEKEPSEATIPTVEVLDVEAPEFAGIGQLIVPIEPGQAAPAEAAVTPAPAPGSGVRLGEVDEAPGGLDRNAIEALRSEICHAFLESAPTKITALRSRLLELTKDRTAANWAAFLHSFHTLASAMTANAGFAGLDRIALFSTALEAFVLDLQEEPEGVSPSSMRTVASALDFLIYLFQEAVQSPEQAPVRALVLVVDDEPICRNSACIALEAARLKTIGLEDPTLALRLLEGNSFDLVVTDVDMPGKDGYELCKELRAMRRHKTTPVVFLTGLTDFQSRARSALSGANEFIVKPFTPTELVVKALNLIMKPQPKAK